MPGELRRVASGDPPVGGTAIVGEAKTPNAPPSDVSGVRSWISAKTRGFVGPPLGPATVEAPIAVYGGGAATSTKVPTRRRRKSKPVPFAGVEGLPPKSPSNAQRRVAEA